jgi:hypothetical protein
MLPLTADGTVISLHVSFIPITIFGRRRTRDMKVDQPVKIYTGVHIFCEEPGSLEWVIHGGDYVRDDIVIPGFVSPES